MYDMYKYLFIVSDYCTFYSCSQFVYDFIYFSQTALNIIFNLRVKIIREECRVHTTNKNYTRHEDIDNVGQRDDGN
jgi:hypothetical protein